jgi:anaerobic selenocysteine-containing dehydrogenase/NADPH-dependent glutamate synthase beta subunit-like oxidoreductase/NAD-dependent dihydropyrimidine dehydrogenase PreA subunit
MAYVVTRTCVDSKYTKCVDVCPVDAFRVGPDMLYIDPDVCIDCNACLSECPVRAIHPDNAVPEAMLEDIGLNARLSKIYPVITQSRDDSAPVTRTPANGSTPRRFAVVGSGPSGFYATEELLKQLPGSAVDIFERLPTPYGLVRYGVAPDHPKIKSVTDSFDAIGRLPKVRFFGNVKVGTDVRREELLAHYDAVVYATGGSVSRPLDVPGAELANVVGGSAFVGWYNGHPDVRDLPLDLSGRTAVVLGLGNVALDIARILVTPVDELAVTDIADEALAALRKSRVREVCLVARRGPAQATFTPGELRKLMDMPGVRIVVDASDLILDEASAADLDAPLNSEARQNVALLREAQSRTVDGDRIIRFVFKASPDAFEGREGRVATMRAVVNTLQRHDDGSVMARGTEEHLQLPADLVINATGYQGVPLDGVAFDAQRSVITHCEGRVLSERGDVQTREYAVGWIKRGASGVIGSNRQCAAQTVRQVAADLAGAPSSAAAVQTDVLALVVERGVDVVSFDDWRLLDRHEREQGEAQGRPRRKEVDVATMLEVIRRGRPPNGGAPSVTVASAKEPDIAAGTTADTPKANLKTHYRTCTLCEAMCGIKIALDGQRIVSIAGDPDDPHSRGHICPKGYALQDLHNDPERIRTPMKRVGDTWLPISWDDALDEVATRLVAIQKQHGNDAVAAYWGNPTAHNLGLMLTLPTFRGQLRTRNVFSASSLDQMPHQLVSYLMYGHSQLFTIPDIDRTDYMLMLGANPAASNGSLMSAGDVLGRLQGITKRGGRIVLIDPRRSETAHYVSEHQFIQPGTDALFLLGLLQIIIDRRLTKPGRLADLVIGWNELPKLLNVLPLDRISELTGIAAADIERIAVEFAGANTAVCYGRMGVSTQSFGTLNHWLIQLLNILTGNLDRAGGMMFTTPAVDLLKSSGRGGFNRYQSRVRKLPEFSRELPTSILAEEILTPGEGQVRAFVSVAGNPVLSSPNGRQVDEALAQLDFMVAVDFYLNETTRHAHILLPPTGPLEHEQYDLVFNLLAVRNVAKYTGPLFDHVEGTRSDWEIFSELTTRMQRLRTRHAPLAKRLKLRASERVSRWLTPARILDLGLRSGPYGKGLSPLQRINPFGKKGLSLAALKKHPHGLDLGPLQPCLPQRLFTKDKKIQLMPAVLIADLQRLAQHYAAGAVTPKLVLIGRRDLRTNNSWMHNSQRLVKGCDRCALYVHPQDAEALGINDRQMARLASARGDIVVTVRLTDEIKRGVVSLPHGWGHHRSGMRISTAQGSPGVSINDITDDQVVDALSGNAVLNGVPVTLHAMAAVDVAS